MTVLLAYVPTAEGSVALDVSIAEATWRACRLVVVNVHLGKKFSDPTFAAQTDLDAVRERLIDAGVRHDVRQFAAVSDVPTVILAEAKSVGAELIVVGQRHRALFGKLLLGSTVQHIILAAECPVLTVRTAA